MDIIQKQLTSPVEQILGTTNKTYRFIVSTESEDRDGDIVKQSGWLLDEFKANPIALLQHKHDMPIGKWSNIHTRKSAKGVMQTVADLTLAPPVSDTLKYAHALVDAGILNATSVGFAVKSAEKRKSADGKPIRGHIIKQALLREISVVSVPANSECLRIAKSLNLDQEVVKSFVTGDISGVDSDYDTDDSDYSRLSAAVDKANELLKGFKPGNTFSKSVFKRENKITDPELLAAYNKAMGILK